VNFFIRPEQTYRYPGMPETFRILLNLAGSATILYKLVVPVFEHGRLQLKILSASPTQLRERSMST
jgi:hypothetical protein